MTIATDEQRMLVDSVQRWAEDACAPAVRAQASHHASGCPPERWHALAEMGWLALPLPEADGGLGGSLTDVALLAEALGHALLVEPFVASGVLAAGLLADTAQEPLRAQWLPALATGERRVAFAPWEPDGCGELVPPQALASQDGKRWRLSGEKGLAPGAGGADGLLLAARIAGAPGAEGQLGLFLVEAGASGLQLDDERLYDGRHAARVRLVDAQAHLVCQAPAQELLARAGRALDCARVAHAAETLGTARLAFDTTREYVGTRRQFGRALGENQVIQHRLVDLYVELQETHALCLAAAVDPSPRLVAALGVRMAEVARHAWEEAIQLHGAIGMTEEYVLGEAIRRLALAADLYGSGPQCAERLAALSLGEEA